MNFEVFFSYFCQRSHPKCHQSLADTFHWVLGMLQMGSGNNLRFWECLFPDYWIVIAIQLEIEEFSAFLLIFFSFKYYDKCTGNANILVQA